MKLFELDETYNLVFQPEVFLLKDFRDLRDSRDDVELLYKELAFIYFYCDLKSDFQFETNIAKRKKDVKKYVDLDPSWTIDEILNDCMDTYLYLSKTVSSQLLQTAYLAVDKFDKQIRDIDLNERDKNNRPIWNQKQMLDMTKSIPELLETVKKAEAEFLKDEEKQTKLRGDKVKTLYEDGFKKLRISE